MKVRVVDFETTGIEPPAQVIEVGWCDVTKEGFETDVGTPRSMLCGVASVSAETRAVHHISIDEVRGLPSFDAVAFMARAEDDGVHAVAAHHADFEAKWLPPSLRRGIPMLCTYKGSLRVFPEAPSHKNQVLRYWLEEQSFTRPDAQLCQPAHRAGPDAYATAHTLVAMLSKVTVPDLLSWTTEPALLPTIPIGKQRGSKWADVEEGFLRWMLRTTDMDKDLKWNAQWELDRRAKKS